MTDSEMLALHREIVEIPSISGDEATLRDRLGGLLAALGVEAQPIGDNLVAVHGSGPVVCLSTHLDTVPPCPGWTRAPHRAVSENGRVYGLGSNDAKASVAAMTAAFLRLRKRAPDPGVRVLLALSAQEETGGKGAEQMVPELRRLGLAPGAVIVGEPTGLDVAVAQKGLLVLELRGEGRACHAAHARALGTPNAIRRLARDLVALETADLGPADPRLGPVTAEPTVVRGGSARNTVPAEATCVLDVRTNPDPGAAEIVARIRSAVSGEVRVLSDRLRPCSIREDHLLVVAALRARAGAKTFGSPGLSDLVFFEGIPGIKVGPGRTERSHTPDEFVLEDEIVEGARFFERAVAEIARSGAAAGGAP